MNGIKKVKNDMFVALNEVGWIRRDVVGYGHDQLVQDPQWWLTDRSGRNVVVEHLCYNFLHNGEESAPPATEEEDEIEDSFVGGNGNRDLGGILTAVTTLTGADRPLATLPDNTKNDSLEKHETTGLYYFRKEPSRKVM